MSAPARVQLEELGLSAQCAEVVQHQREQVTDLQNQIKAIEENLRELRQS